jgi:hypothetical protein
MISDEEYMNNKELRGKIWEALGVYNSKKKKALKIYKEAGEKASSIRDIAVAEANEVCDQVWKTYKKAETDYDIIHKEEQPNNNPTTTK